jgi:small-conductance mechanosensitive channel
VAVNAALRAAGIKIAFPQRIVHLEQNDNPSKQPSDPHRAGAGGNLPPRDGDNLADTGNASLSSGDSLTN